MFAKFRLKKLSQEVNASPKQKRGPLWLIAVLVSALAGLGVYYAFMSVYQPVEIVVAAKELKPMQKIEQADVKLQSISKRDLHPKMATSVKSVVGAYTTMPLTEGEPILSTKVVRSPGNMVETYGTLKPNETIVVLKSSQVSWPDVIREGDMVSAVAVYNDKNTDRGVDVARNIRVVSSSRPLPVVGELKSAKDAQARPTSEITLLMDREDAKKLLYATVNAKSVSLLPETNSR